MARKKTAVKKRRTRKVLEAVEVKKTTIKCAFCEGTGKDPFGIPSILSNCQVCLGRGTVEIQEPFVKCAFCGGTGVHGGQRLTCLACKGKGVATIQEPVEECPDCKGTGADPFGLYCWRCKGKGVVTVKEGE